MAFVYEYSSRMVTIKKKTSKNLTITRYLTKTVQTVTFIINYMQSV